jgi:hypothetical protein
MAGFGSVSVDDDVVDRFNHRDLDMVGGHGGETGCFGPAVDGQAHQVNLAQIRIDGKTNARVTHFSLPAASTAASSFYI